MDHMRGEEKVGEYGRKDLYVAHGPDQTFFELPEDDQNRPLLKGDSLRVHCLVDTSASDVQIPYGVSHGTEMCTVLFMYKNYSVLNTKSQKLNNVITVCSDRNSNFCQSVLVKPPIFGL